MATSELRKLIAGAFDRPELIDDQHVLPHEDCIALRCKLPHLPLPDLRRYLPVALIDAITHPVASPIDSEYAEMLIYFLISAEDSFVPEGQQVDATVLDRLKDQDRQMFAQFGYQECTAIVRWLETIEHWPMFDLAREDMPVALEFRRQCQERQGPGGHDADGK